MITKHGFLLHCRTFIYLLFFILVTLYRNRCLCFNLRRHTGNTTFDIKSLSRILDWWGERQIKYIKYYIVSNKCTRYTHVYVSFAQQAQCEYPHSNYLWPSQLKVCKKNGSSYTACAFTKMTWRALVCIMICKYFW